MSERLGFFLAVLILLLSAGLRLWEVDTIPQGLSDQEISDIRLADYISSGNVTVFYEQDGEPQEGLYSSVLALISTITGGGVVGYRIISIWAGMITVAYSYALGKRLYGTVPGLLAMFFMGVVMASVILSRIAVSESLLPLVVVSMMYSFSWLVPIRGRMPSNRIMASTLAGVVAGTSLYVHPVAVALVFTIFCFFIFIFMMRRKAWKSKDALGNVIFSFVIMLIIAMPYFLSSLAMPDLRGIGRIFESTPSILQSLVYGIGGVSGWGDMNPVINLPGRPLVDLLNVVLILMGIVYCFHRWRDAQYVYPLIASAFLFPIVLLSETSPDFLSFSILLPLFALFFGVGGDLLAKVGSKQWRWIPRIAVVALLAFLLGSSIYDLFFVWVNDEDVQTAYHSDLGAIAHHLDMTAGDMPTVICDADRGAFSLDSPDEPTNAQLIVDFMMHRQNANVRYADCRTSLVFINGGLTEQIVFPDTDVIPEINQHLIDWLVNGELINQSGEPNAIVTLNVENVLADRAGLFTTQSPARYIPNNATIGAPVQPPIRFGGNITLLGFNIPEIPYYVAGDQIPVITYWRVEGVIPPDLTFFTHVSRDPSTIAAQQDAISVAAETLRERDVFIQVATIDSSNMIEGQYFVSVGAYQDETGQRLDVLDQDQSPRGNQLFLYPVIVEANNREE